MRRFSPCACATPTACLLWLLTGFVVGRGLLPQAAYAQSIDYGAFEQLFGEPVTTSAIGTPQRARDVPADLEIVTADDIRRSGATDIPGVLSHVVGVDVQRWSILGADVGLRGYDGPFNPRLLVLINGQQVYADDYGRTEWAALPVELTDIRQIEVVKGPNSALFGFNAAGGVINIITYNPVYDHINTATLRGGTQGYADASATGTAKFGHDIAVRLSAGGTRTDEFGSVRNIGTLEGLRNNTNRAEISADGHWQINASSEFELSATHGQDERLTPIPLGLNVYIQNATESVLGRYTADTRFGVITGTAYRNWSDIKVVTPRFPNTDYGNALTVVSLQDIFKPRAEQTVRVALEYRNSTINTNPIAGGILAYNIAAVSGMWNWNILPNLSLTAAPRVDVLWLQRSGAPLVGSGLTNDEWAKRVAEPSYNLGAVWHVGEMDTLRATIARGVQLPTLVEYGALQGLTTFGIAGQPNIKSTVLDNYEVDWDRTLSSVNAQARLAAFYQISHDIQSLVSPNNVSFAPGRYLLILSGNIGNSTEIGAELSLRGHFSHDNWRWQLSYSPRFVQQQFAGVASPATTGSDFPRSTPRHIINASLGWSSGPWEADSFIRFESSSAGVFTPNLSSYSVVPVGASVSVDARIAYHFSKNFTASLSGQNILFSAARQTFFGKVEQRVLGGLTANF